MDGDIDLNKLLYLEISRGIAALLVVFHHTGLGATSFLNNRTFGEFFKFGHHGVDFFFVLSGFIIYYIHSNDNGSLFNIKNYAIKRIIRIYPIFLLISSVLLIAYLELPELGNRADNIITIERIVNSFLLIPSIEKPILSVSWTLIHEVFFYVIFIVVIINKKIGMILFSLWFILIVNYNLFFEKSFPYSFYLNAHNLEFLFGIGTAYIFMSESDYFFKLKRNSNRVFLLGLIGFILNGMNTNYNFININTFYQILFYGISSSFIIYGLVLFKEPIMKNKIFRIFLLIGSASYSIYLIHDPLISVLFRIIKKINLGLYLHDIFLFLLITVISVMVGILLHLIIEKPIVRFLRTNFINIKD